MADQRDAARKDRENQGSEEAAKREAPVAPVPNDDIEKAWWMTCWLDKDLRLYRAPIASRLTEIAGSHESQSNLLVLSSAYNLPLRVGESLEYLAMKAFASASMMSPSGRNNELPYASGNEFVEIHTDSSAKVGVLGISAVFSVADCSYSYAGGMIVDSNLLIFNFGEFVAAVSAMLVAMSHGYRHILVSTDCEALVRTWDGEETGTMSENVDRQLVALKEIATSQGFSISVRHVKGHGIDFHNTMADGLAEMGYARSSVADRDLDAFGYKELRQAYEETLKLNERLGALVGRIEEEQAQEQEQAGTGDETETSSGIETEDGAETDRQGGGQPQPVAPAEEADPSPDAPDTIPEQAPTTPTVSQIPGQAAQEEGVRHDTHQEGEHPVRQDGTRPVRQDAPRSADRPDIPAASVSAQASHGRQRRNRSGRQGQVPEQTRAHSLAINQATVEICRLLNKRYDHVSVNRVDRLVAGGAIEKWDSLDDNPTYMEYARNLVSGGGATPDNRVMDAIWDALAKNVARKIARKYSAQKKRSFLVMRTMLVARLCGVPIEPSIDYVIENMQG